MDLSAIGKGFPAYRPIKARRLTKNIISPALLPCYAAEIRRPQIKRRHHEWRLPGLNTPSQTAANAYVNYNHTCYPAHQITVNGSQVYLYSPPSNTFAYIAVCLSGLNKVIGQTGTMSVPVH